jgi:predicted NAD-dependent protein-ADP-ribosyltransferase YbiA (DUF1768 family)
LNLLLDRHTDIDGNPIIASFSSDHGFLSNFYQAKIHYKGIEFPTTEHAYQWEKTTNADEKHAILWRRVGTIWLGGPGIDAAYYEVPTTAAQAKQEGKNVSLRLDWKAVRFGLMLQINRAKYTQHPDLLAKLLATGDSLLVEGNTWHDCYWGVCTCLRCGSEGENMLGQVLMALRDSFRI